MRKLLPIAFSLLASLNALTSLAATSGATKNVVLVHGGLVDGSVWRGVYNILQRDGFHVSIVQNSLKSIDDDVAITKRVLDQQDGPVVLVGQSLGGSIITVAGTDPKVTALVYIAALQPDKGENANDLNSRMPSESAKEVKSTADGYYYFPRDRFAALFAADIPAADAAFLAAAQQPMAEAMFTGRTSEAAWRTKPSFAVVATEDKAMNPDLQRFMYKRSGAKVLEIKGSHAVFISHPREVARLIEEAAHAGSPVAP